MSFRSTTGRSVPDFRKLSQKEVHELTQKHKLFVKGRTGGARANFTGADLGYLNFKYLDLSGADFSGSRLAHADCRKAIFISTDFFACDLRHADWS